MEALLRWNHPERGLLLPAEFIPVAEETGQILMIGEWVLRSACTQCKAWQLQGLPPTRVSINLSTLQFQQDGLIQAIDTILKETGLDPKYLELEALKTP
jgi:EAL domain-containing protein (putative c-di-GMP-specific phosphodiesterase class I)